MTLISVFLAYEFSVTRLGVEQINLKITLVEKRTLDWFFFLLLINIIVDVGAAKERWRCFETEKDRMGKLCVILCTLEATNANRNDAFYEAKI